MIRDHEGNIFSNQKRMCEAHGVNYLTYHTRKRKGWTMEECLGYKKRSNPKATNKENSRKAVDHLGQEFHSTRAMCFHWNVSQAVFNGRINRGWTLKEALEIPPKKFYIGQERERRKIQIDHTGKKFNSIAQMCRYWEVTYYNFLNRRRRGWTLEEALTGKRKQVESELQENKEKSELETKELSKKNEKTEKPKDHLGNEYNTIQEMCEHWGIEYKRFYYRIHNYKWSLEKALAEPVRNGLKAGQTVNNLEILDKFRKNGQTLYKTKCLKCGEKREVFDYGLKYGCVSCNKKEHLKKNQEKKQKKLEELKKEYEGKTINNLKILEVKDIIKNNSNVVKCECCCGKIFETELYKVTSGNTTTCGHNTDKNLKKGMDLVKECSVEGTNVLSLVSRKNINKNNTSGVKGVSQFNSGILKGKYRAYINFKRKQYNLGVYNTLEDAASARKEAEEKIYGDFLKWYAENHPEQWEKIKGKGEEK